MRLQVKGKNVEVSDSLYRYAEEKLGKLDKHLNDATRLELELAVEKNPSISASQVAEATVWTKGPILRARESSEDMRASIDMLVEKLERQVKRYREKRQRQADRTAPTPPPTRRGGEAGGRRRDRAADREDEAVRGQADDARRRRCSSWS